MPSDSPRPRTVTRAIQGVASPDPLVQAESAVILIHVILDKLVRFAVSHRLFGGIEVEHLLNDIASDVWLRIREGKLTLRSREDLFRYLYAIVGNKAKSRSAAIRRAAPPVELESVLDTSNPDPEELERCALFLEALETRLKPAEATLLKASVLGYRREEIRPMMGLGMNAYRVLITSLREKVRKLRPDGPPQAIGRPSGGDGPQPPPMEDSAESIVEVMRETVMGFLAAADDAPPVHNNP